MSGAVIHSIILKVAAPCNLDCGYCYEYNRGDDSWKARPKLIARATVERLAFRIKEYCRDAGLTTFRVNLHGGEPTLLGPERLADVVSTIRDGTPGIRVEFGLQTNATLISASLIAVFNEHEIRVGASLDGSAEANRHRIDHQGRPTWATAVDGIRQLRDAGCLAGIQAVIDLDSPPEEVLGPLVDLGARLIELGQPFGTYDNPPQAGAYALGAWLIEAFDLWVADSRFARAKVQVFHDAIRAVLTERPDSEWFPGLPPGYLVVGTDGAYEGLDTLKVVGERGRVLGCGVFDTEISRALEHDYIAARGGPAQLCEACSSCGIVSWCAGGYYPTRFGLGNGFMNPSLYCEDLRFFFIHVANWLLEQEDVGATRKERIRERLSRLKSAAPNLRPALAKSPKLQLTIRGKPIGQGAGRGGEG